MISYKDYVRLVIVIKDMQESMSRIDFADWLMNTSSIEDYREDFPNYEKFLVHLVTLNTRILIDRDFFNNYIYGKI